MDRGTGTIKPKLPRDGGQPCGCDPKNDYTCEGHAGHEDESTTEIPGAIGHHDEPLTLMIDGPDDRGSIGLLTTRDCIGMPRFVALDLAREILRRLEPRTK